jgi:lipopolysaccharide transport system permease protein
MRSRHLEIQVMSADLALLEVAAPATALHEGTGDDSGEMALAAYQVPDKPLVVLRPTGRWAALDLRGLWAHRELLYFLTWRDVKVRYKQTLLGAVWAIIQPLFAMVIFAFFFGRLAQMPSDGIPYPLFAYTGLLPWTFFASALASSGNSLISNANLITKVYFPRVIIPSAAVAANLVDFAIAFVILLVLIGYYGVVPTASVVLLPLLLLLTTLLALGVGMWMSALNVKYRDIRYALPLLIQLWMFASPIIYPASLMPQRWRWVLALNPMTGIIEGYRSALLARPVDWLSLWLSTVLVVVIYVIAAFHFRSMEKDFADVV